MKALTLILALLLPLLCHAQADKGGNGGDPQEEEFRKIALEFRSWIQAQGHADLNFSKGDFSLHAGGTPRDQVYASEMSNWISSAVVEMTDQLVEVNDIEKVCRNDDARPGNPGTPARILCNRSAWSALNEVQRFRMVHHEYACLSKFEHTGFYGLSDQIENSMEYRVEWKLVVRPSPPSRITCSVDFNGKYSGDEDQPELKDDLLFILIDADQAHGHAKRYHGTKGYPDRYPVQDEESYKGWKQLASGELTQFNLRREKLTVSGYPTIGGVEYELEISQNIEGDKLSNYYSGFLRQTRKGNLFHLNCMLYDKVMREDFNVKNPQITAESMNILDFLD